MKNGTLTVLWYSGDSETAGRVDGILRGAGCVVHRASSTMETEAAARRRPVDVVVVDVRDAADAAFEILAHLRRHTSVPVVLVTDGDSEFAGRCLELGADDCVPWPISARELTARVRLRGGHCGSHRKPAARNIEIDAVDRQVVLDGDTVELTDREFELLAYLAASPGVAFSSEQLLSVVWGSRREWQSVTTVTEHVYRLRKKLEIDPANPSLIVTIRGRGYTFAG